MSRLAKAAAVIALAGANAATTTGTSSAVGTYEQCHWQTLTGIAGGYISSTNRTGGITKAHVSSKSATNPTATFQAPDGTAYVLTGNSSYTASFNGVYWTGKYTYDYKYTAPDGSVWGTWKGSMGLDICGRPYGARTETCAAA